MTIKINQPFKSWWEAFRYPMNKKSWLPFSIRMQEVIAIWPIVTGIVSTYLFTMFLVFPDFLEFHPGYLFIMRTLWTCLLIAILSNLYLVRKRTSSIRDRMLPQPVTQPIFPTNQLNSENEVEKTTKHMEEHYKATPFGNAENWHICAACKVFVPPRTWHCHYCQTCILRRDHHCVLTGTCIGEENQSNFIGFIFYLAVGLTLSIVFSVTYHFYIMDQENISSFIYRSTMIYNLPYVVAAFFVVGKIVAWIMLSVFIRNALKGQTAADVHRKAYWTRTVLGCGRASFGNMQDFLGPRPILRILWPFHSPLKINYDIVRVGGNADGEVRKGLEKSD